MGAVVTPNSADMTSLYRGQNAGLASMPTINFCGTTYNTVRVYTMGYLDFSDSWHYWYTTLAASNAPLIAPLLNNATNYDQPPAGPVTYGITTYEGLPSLMVTWDHIGHYDPSWNALYDFVNTFQVIIQVITSDLWNLILNYDSVQWVNTYTNAGFIRYNTPTMKSYFLLPGSETAPSTMRDGQPNALVSSHSTGTTVNGRYIYSVRNGIPQGTGWVDPALTPTPDPLQASSRAFRPVGIYL